MVNIETCAKVALEFEDCLESPHFEKRSFRVRKKIFLTLDIINKRITIKLDPVEQSVFCVVDPSAVYPATGKWGKDGWTLIELKNVRRDLVISAITASYCNVAPESLAKKYRMN